MISITANCEGICTYFGILTNKRFVGTGNCF